MNQTEPKIKSSRLQLMLVAALFLGPLVVAMVLYYGEIQWRPVDHSNHGMLLQPIENVVESLDNKNTVASLDEQWSLVYSSDDDCGLDSTCRERLYKMRQVRLMLGKNMGRIQRVFLAGKQRPDEEYLSTEQAGLLLLDDVELTAALGTHLAAGVAPGGYFLIDPRGNLVMYFEPGLDPRDMLGDLKRLLSLSHIG